MKINAAKIQQAPTMEEFIKSRDSTIEKPHYVMFTTEYGNRHVLKITKAEYEDGSLKSFNFEGLDEEFNTVSGWYHFGYKEGYINEVVEE